MPICRTLSLAAVGLLIAGALALAEDSSAASQEHPSLTAPVGDFIHDSILKPTAPFELVPGKDPNAWGFVLEPYAWAMGLQGEIGAKGFPPVNIGFSNRTILQHLNWGVFARGEIRKGRWGVLADGYYADLSSSASLENRLYSNASLGLQQSLASLALAYRIIDDRRGFLDLYAGVRYNFLGTQVDASLNNSRINQIGDNVTNRLADGLDSRLDAAIKSAVDKYSSQIASTIESAVDKFSSQVASAESEAVGLIKQRISESDIRRLLIQDRDIRDLVRDGYIKRNLVDGAVRSAFDEYVRATARAKVAAARAAADASLEADAASLEADAAKAKKKLSNAIANRIEKVTPTHAAANQWWFDPIIGLRGQINITRWLFLAIQGDTGGFSLGSSMAWNAQSTIGVNFTRNVFAEIGYRYMYVDYTNDGFLYQMNSYGLFTGVGVKF